MTENLFSHFEIALTSALFIKSERNDLQREDIVEIAYKLARISNIEDKEVIESVIRKVESRLVVRMPEGISLIDRDATHDEKWHRKLEGEIKWTYSNDYYSFLLQKNSNWSPKVINTMRDITGKILGLLKNPNDSSEWDRRGLVIGHVQSGKTANYIGLISKAADAGYKFIIVIAGIHNNLRKQTQKRIDEGFVGRDSSPDSKEPVGVGLWNPNRQNPVSFTTTYRDFTKGLASQLGADLQGFSRPVVIVIKKNVTTLKNLLNWLKEWNLPVSSNRISDVPMLMIDDEADHASINTNKPLTDPTKTNSEIRKILKLFRKSCYVGYTATPFANIFINPDNDHEMLKDDLFPKDFIYCLEPPDNYFGPDKVFADDEDFSNKILRTIDDAENYIPLKHTKEHTPQDIPPSMKQAIHTFIIGKAVRILRGDENKHCSMMINASRFVEVQKRIKEHASYYIRSIANEVRYNYSLPVHCAVRNRYIATLKKTYDEDFCDLKEKWIDVQKQLRNAVDSIETCLINSKSDDSLNYESYEKDRKSRTVIAVGGLSISRGLTLEGLITSYMYRNTKMYDTLMQMGRWFGYRENYEDLCKVWLSDESQGWYSYIAEATEELRDQVRQMRRQGLAPKDFGLYVRSHPDTPLIVTARNKMGDAEKIKFKTNLSGQLVETHALPSDEEITEQNRHLIGGLFDKLNKQYPDHFKEHDEIPGPKAYYWNKVGWEILERFLNQFRFHKQIQYKRDSVLAYLRKISNRYPNVDIAFMSLVNPKKSYLIGDDERKIACQERSVATSNGEPKKTDREDGWFVTNKQRVASRWAERVGLSEDKQKEAEEPQGGKDQTADHHYRNVRPRPLLMVHILNLKNKDSFLSCNVPAIGVSFPSGDYSESAEYVVNSIYLKQDMYDFPDEEDDYGI